MKQLDQQQTEQVSGAKLIIKCPPIRKPPVITTLALGEEGGPRITTLALGEEGPVMTTLALGEEGGGGTTVETASALGSF